MHYVLLYVLFMVTFTQLLRYSQRRGATVLPVCAVNYVVAAILSTGALAVFGWRGLLVDQWPAAALGAVNGVLYVVTLVVLLASYRLVGVGITSAVMAMGTLIPVLVSWSIWSEPMTPFRWGAVALLPLAMILLRPAGADGHKLTFKADAVMCLAFVMAGTIGTIHKASDECAPAGSRGVYLAALLPQGLFRAANRARQNLGKPEFVSRKEVESIDAFEVLGLT